MTSIYGDLTVVRKVKVSQTFINMLREDNKELNMRSEPAKPVVEPKSELPAFDFPKTEIDYGFTPARTQSLDENLIVVNNTEIKPAAPSFSPVTPAHVTEADTSTVINNIVAMKETVSKLEKEKQDSAQKIADLETKLLEANKNLSFINEKNNDLEKTITLSSAEMDNIKSELRKVNEEKEVANSKYNQLMNAVSSAINDEK